MNRPVRLKFFADHCISNRVIQMLQADGCEVFRVREHIPPDAPDPKVIAKAQELDAILISIDGDFSDIIAYPPKNYKEIIALQVRNHPEVIPQIMNKLIDYLYSHQDMSHYRGTLFLIEPHRIRIRS